MKDCRRCFLVFIFVLLSVICGYFFFQNYQLKKQIKDFQPVLFPSSSPFPPVVYRPHRRREIVKRVVSFAPKFVPWSVLTHRPTSVVQTENHTVVLVRPAPMKKFSGFENKISHVNNLSESGKFTF